VTNIIELKLSKIINSILRTNKINL